MKKLISLVAVAAIAYGVVSVAAASLSVTADQTLPQAGVETTVAGGCAAGAAVTYTISGSNVTALVLTLDDNGACAGKTIVWQKDGADIVAAQAIDSEMTAVSGTAEATIVASTDTVITYTYTTAPTIAAFTATSFGVTLY